MPAANAFNQPVLFHNRIWSIEVQRDPVCCNSKLRTAFGSTTTLKAEVLWTFHTVTKHQSYTGNENSDELFQTMFRDSEIAKAFSK